MLTHSLCDRLRLSMAATQSSPASSLAYRALGSPLESNRLLPPRNTTPRIVNTPMPEQHPRVNGSLCGLHGTAQSLAASRPGNTCTSFGSPLPVARVPLVVRRDICRNYRQVIRLRSAHDVNCAMTLSFTEQETAMPSRIFWIVLDYLSHINHASHLGGAYQPVRPRHLPDRVRKVQNPLSCSRTYPLNHRLLPGLIPRTDTMPGSVWT